MKLIPTAAASKSRQASPGTGYPGDLLPLLVACALSHAVQQQQCLAFHLWCLATTQLQRVTSKKSEIQCSNAIASLQVLWQLSIFRRLFCIDSA